MPGGRGPNSNRRLLFGAGIVAGGALLLNWIFGEEEYDLGKSRDIVLLTLLLFLSYEWEWVRKRKKRKEELTYRLVFFLKFSVSLSEEEAWSAIQRGELGNFYEGVDEQGRRFVVDAESNIGYETLDPNGKPNADSLDGYVVTADGSSKYYPPSLILLCQANSFLSLFLFKPP